MSIFKFFKTNRIKNELILGSSGSGKGYHPWDNLKQCTCGGVPFLKGKNGVFETGFPYKIICLNCEKSTNDGEVDYIKKQWNDELN